MVSPSRSIKILIVLLSLNAAVGMFEASGLADAMGVEPTTGIGDDFSDAQDTAEGLSPTSGIADLAGVILQTAADITGVFQVLWAGPLMLMNLGVPDWLVAAIFAPLWAIIFRDTVYFITGR